MSRSFARRGPGLAALVTAVLVAVSLVVLGAAHPRPASADAAGKGGDFVPLTGNHILLDTRSGTGAAKGTRAAGSTTVFTVAGVSGVPATGVRAVFVTLIAVASANTWLEAWPDGATRPPTSIVDAPAGQIVSNAAVVPIGSNGKADVYTSGKSDIVVEAEGYFTAATGTTGGGFVPVTQTRLVDTRTGAGIGGTAKKVPAGGSITATVATGSPIPTTASSILVNATALPTAKGWLGVFSSGTAGNSAVDFETGAAASTVAVKLGANGTVSLFNSSSAAINVVLDAEGYFTATPTTGAGLRLVPSMRILDTGSANIASGATVDVQVGGAHGLPTRYIAGALLDLHALSTTASGYVTAWPVGQAEPSGVSLTQFPASTTRDDTVAVNVGTDGKVRVRNHSSAAIRLVVDLQGWFEDPLPAVSPVAFAVTQVVQAAPLPGAVVGSLEYSYVDNIGRVVWGHQPDPSNPLGVTWTVISGNEAFSGPPALAVQPNGNLLLAAEHGDGNVWSAGEAAGATSFGPFTNQGGSMASAPVVGTQTDGSLVLFAVDAGGQLWALPQSGANGGFTSWHPLGVTVVAGSVAVTTVQTGIAVFGLDTSGGLHTATLSTATTLSAWTSLGGTGLTGHPALVVYPGFRVRVFVTGGDGVVVTKEQDASGVWPVDFAPVAGLVASGSPAAVLSPQSGLTEVVARSDAGDTSGGNVFFTQEVTQGSGTWQAWKIAAPVGTSTDLAATDPTAFTLNQGSGLTWAFVYRTADNRSLLFTVSLGGSAGAQPAFHSQQLPVPAR